MSTEECEADVSEMAAEAGNKIQSEREVTIQAEETGQQSEIEVNTEPAEETEQRSESEVNAGPAEETGQQSDAPVLTKNQQKKLKKQEKRDAVRAQKRKEEKERAKARKRALRERGEELGPSRKQLKHNRMSNSSCKVRVVVDCDFDDFMTEKDIKMLVKQIQFSYSANRRALNPLQFYCCGISGKTEERLKSLGDYKGWDVRFRCQSYLEEFDQSSVVYLSSESPNMLDTLHEDKVYIIGGLVDHNHHKGLCHRLAEEKGIAHAQLPISDYINMKTRKVFTINHVFEMLLRYTETKDWQKAFFTVLPPRKGAVLKNAELNKSSDSVGVKLDADSKDTVEDKGERSPDSEVLNNENNNGDVTENSDVECDTQGDNSCCLEGTDTGMDKSEVDSQKRQACASSKGGNPSNASDDTVGDTEASNGCLDKPSDSTEDVKLDISNETTELGSCS